MSVVGMQLECVLSLLKVRTGMDRYELNLVLKAIQTWKHTKV